MSALLDLAAVIAQVESGGNPSALRFESSLYVAWGTLTPARSTILANIADAHKCSHHTARMIACTSWGLYQILGENLYSGVCGYFDSVFQFVLDMPEQTACLNNFLRNKGIAFSLDDILADRTKREQFIATYNGPGGQQAYWEEMQAAIARLGGSVPNIDV